MLDAVEDAKLTYGVGVSLAKIAYHVTGLGILSDRGKRWSAQTISDKLNIADIQNASITAAWRRIEGVYGRDGIVQDAELMKWWRNALIEEVIELEDLERQISARLSRPPKIYSRPIL